MNRRSRVKFVENAKAKVVEGLSTYEAWQLGLTALSFGTF